MREEPGVCIWAGRWRLTGKLWFSAERTAVEREEQLLTWSSQRLLAGFRVVLRDWAGIVAGFRRKSDMWAASF